MNLDELKKKSKETLNDIGENVKKVDLKDVKEKGKKLADNIGESAKHIDVDDMKNKGRKVAENISNLGKQGGVKNLLGNKKLLIAIGVIFIVLSFIVGTSTTMSERDKKAIAAAVEAMESKSFEEAQELVEGASGKKAKKLRDALRIYNLASDGFYTCRTFEGDAMNPEEVFKYCRAILKQINNSYKDYPDLLAAVDELNDDIDVSEEFTEGIVGAIGEIESLINEGKYLESNDVADEWVDKIEKFDRNSTLGTVFMDLIWQYSSSSTLNSQERAAQRQQLLEQEKQEHITDIEEKKQEIQKLYDDGKRDEAKQKAKDVMDELGFRNSGAVTFYEADWGVSDDFMNFVDTLFPELAGELANESMPERTEE